MVRIFKYIQKSILQTIEVQIIEVQINSIIIIIKFEQLKRKK